MYLIPYGYTKQIIFFSPFGIIYAIRIDKEDQELFVRVLACEYTAKSFDQKTAKQICAAIIKGERPVSFGELKRQRQK